MNRRRIRRQLHQGARNTFWGRRGFITIRFPDTVLPPKPSLAAMEKYGKFDDLLGMCWKRKLPDGTIGLWVSNNVSGPNPVCRGDKRRTLIDVYETTDYDSYTRAQYADCMYMRYQDREGKKPRRWYFRVPEADIAVLREYLRWQRAQQHYEDGNVFIDAITRYWAAKTHYITVEDGFVDVTYSVKPHYTRLFVKNDANNILNRLDHLVKTGVIPWYRVLR